MRSVSASPSVAPSQPFPANTGLQTAGVPWYVVYTCSHHEREVERRLGHLGLEVFLPRLTVSSRRKHAQTLQVPLFPGYLFVHEPLETSSAYYLLLKVPGVVRVLGQQGKLYAVPLETIESLRLAVISDRPYYPCRYLIRGQWVRVLEGPLTGVTGIIRGLKEPQRKVVVEVELFHRAMAVELADEAVELLH